jgi:hypothetical protein
MRTATEVRKLSQPPPGVPPDPYGQRIGEPVNDGARVRDRTVPTASPLVTSCAALPGPPGDLRPR